MTESLLYDPWTLVVGVLLLGAGATAFLAVLAGSRGRAAGGLWVMALFLLVPAILVGCAALIL